MPHLRKKCLIIYKKKIDVEKSSLVRVYRISEALCITWYKPSLEKSIVFLGFSSAKVEAFPVEKWDLIWALM